MIRTKALYIRSGVLKAPDTLLPCFRVHVSVGGHATAVNGKKKVTDRCKCIHILRRFDGADQNSLNSRDMESLK